MRMNLVALYLCIYSASYVQYGEGANWAQSSGRIHQNTVIPKYPSPDSPHWAPRYAMASVVQPLTNLSSFTYLYVMGGDSYTTDFSAFNYIPGMIDLVWENGFKNDVWRTTGTTWQVEGDIRLRTEYKRKIPRVSSELTWELVTPGLHPPRGTTYEEWISCQPSFQNNVNTPVNCTGQNQEVMWSPRRAHAGTYFAGYLWIMGGRAREFVTISHAQTIGGILGPLVQDVPLTLGNQQQQFSTQREIAYLKNDVWKSPDGSTWTLVTPGCRVDQYSQGTQQYLCSNNNDCFGAEICQNGACVCGMWGPREQHAVASYGNQLYISGGFAAQLYPQYSKCGMYACGDIDATSYRIYLSDVWSSPDGNTWNPVTNGAFADPLTPQFPPKARGGHQMLAFTDSQGDPYLWVFGGQGGSNQPEGGPIIYYNDIWRSPLSGNTPKIWSKVNVTDEFGNPSYDMPWTNRTGHGVALEEGTPDNLNIRTLYLYGGENNGTYFNDLWTWRIDDPNEFWREDFTIYEYYATGAGSEFHYSNSSPSRFYVTPLSNISALKRFWIPADPSENTFTPYQLRPYLTTYAIASMNSVGIYTISDLANADVYTILKLRGYDYPEVPLDQRLHVDSICDYRALAIAVVEKCTVTIPDLYDGEQQMPWNVIPVFGGAPPTNMSIKWHGRRNYNFLLPPADDPTVLISEWDGCTYNPLIEGLFGPNVPGLGYVQQVASVANPAPVLENLFCQQTPGARAYHGMVMFEERLYVVGGQLNQSYFYADAWYRDATLPNAFMISPPESHTSNPYFPLNSDKAGCYYEYRIWDPYNYEEIRGWAPVVKKASVAWLNWRKHGPGTGRYQIYFRAVDPAGNRDYGFKMGTNVYNWYYVSPTPWDIIFSVIGSFIGLCIVAYFEYRRRVKKAAMERYAMKRMRRKFKAMQRDIDGKAVDWRTLYMESKQAEEAGAAKDKKKKIKKTKDKSAEKREKEKKKREKEKELIKKKLKATKEYKEKAKKGGGDSVAPDSTIQATVVTKKSEAKNLKTSKVIPSGDVEADFMFEEEKAAGGKSVPKAKGGAKVLEVGLKKTGKVLPDASEAGPGELLAAKNTELGFKQRKVNKRMKTYEENEEKDNNPNGGGKKDS